MHRGSSVIHSASIRSHQVPVDTTYIPVQVPSRTKVRNNKSYLLPGKMDDANANATVGRRVTGLGEKEEPRRSKSKRDRKKVTLLSSEYSTIYDDANNRKKKEPDKKKEDLQIQQTLSLSLTQPKSKPKSTIKKKKGKADVSSAATYRWIGKGKMREGNRNELCFDAVEIQVGGHPALIEVGDNVLISSHDTEESEVFDKSASTVNRNQYLNGGENLDKTKIPMNGLAPFVGKVESLWEVDIGGGVAAGKKKNSSDAKSNVNDVVKGGDARSNRMKVLIRWYYKVRHIIVHNKFTHHISWPEDLTPQMAHRYIYRK